MYIYCRINLYKFRIDSHSVYSTMSNRLRRYHDHLKVLQKARPIERRALISVAQPELINTICECARNILHNRIPLSKKSKRKLYPYRSQLRKLNDKRVGVADKKRILLQKGGFLLPLLLSTVAPIVSSLVSGLWRK